MAQNVNERSLTKSIVHRLPEMVGLVALNADIELREVEVNEIARAIRPRDKLLRDRSQFIITKTVPNCIDYIVLIVFAARS